MIAWSDMEAAMGIWVWIGTGLAALVVAAGAAAMALRLSDLRADRQGMSALLAQAGPPAGVFDPAMLESLPEPARRYLARAIAPGTPLARAVTLEMAGQFVLNGKALPMMARQVLAPPAGFVWQARIGQGAAAFAGSDGLVAGQSWTRFRLAGLVPLVRVGGNADHLRSAGTRAMMEAVWCPAMLLPQAGAVWRQTGPDQAEVAFPAHPDIAPVQLTIGPDGLITGMAAMRWSDANADKRYRLQPFGGPVLESGTFGGFTIPVRMEMGNLWGTPDYAPFFRADVTAARF
jgi:hypothetical protein